MWSLFIFLVNSTTVFLFCFLFRFHQKILWRHWSWWSIDMEPRISKQAKIQAYCLREPSISWMWIPCTGGITPRRAQRKLRVPKVSASRTALWPMATDGVLPNWGGWWGACQCRSLWFFWCSCHYCANHSMNLNYLVNNLVELFISSHYIWFIRTMLENHCAPILLLSSSYLESSFISSVSLIIPYKYNFTLCSDLIESRHYFRFTGIRNDGYLSM